MVIKRGVILGTFSLFVLLFCSVVSAQAQDSKIDDGNVRDSKAQILSMAHKLAIAEGYSTTIAVKYDVVQENGQKIEFAETRKVVVQRPNYLRIDALQSDGDKTQLFFDGKQITLISAADNVYSVIPFVGSIDDAVLYAGGTLGIRLPLARMLVTQFPQLLDSIITEAAFVETNVLDGEVVHLAARSADVDLQAWISVDDLPQRIVLTYKNEPGQPQFRADFSEWRLITEVVQEIFTFVPSKGAEKIPSLSLKQGVNSASEQKKGATK